MVAAANGNGRYQVEVVGVPPPPDACYVVLNPAHDMEARIALWRLVRCYRYSRQETKAQEIEAILRESEVEFARMMIARNPKKQSKETKQARH